MHPHCIQVDSDNRVEDNKKLLQIQNPKENAGTDNIIYMPSPIRHEEIKKNK